MRMISNMLLKISISFLISIQKYNNFQQSSQKMEVQTGFQNIYEFQPLTHHFVNFWQVLPYTVLEKQLGFSLRQLREINESLRNSMYPQGFSEKIQESYLKLKAFYEKGVEQMQKEEKQFYANSGISDLNRRFPKMDHPSKRYFYNGYIKNAKAFQSYRAKFELIVPYKTMNRFHENAMFYLSKQISRDPNFQNIQHDILELDGELFYAPIPGIPLPKNDPVPRNSQIQRQTEFQGRPQNQNYKNYSNNQRHHSRQGANQNYRQNQRNYNRGYQNQGGYQGNKQNKDKIQYIGKEEKEEQNRRKKEQEQKMRLCAEQKKTSSKENEEKKAIEGEVEQKKIEEKKVEQKKEEKKMEQKVEQKVEQKEQKKVEEIIEEKKMEQKVQENIECSSEKQDKEEQGVNKKKQKTEQKSQSIQKESQQIQQQKKSEPSLSTKKYSLPEMIKFIQSTPLSKLMRSVRPQLIDQIQETKDTWIKSEKIIQPANTNISLGGKKTGVQVFQSNPETNKQQAPQIRFGIGIKKGGTDSFEFVLGKNENPQTKLEKEKLRQQARERDFAKQKQEQANLKGNQQVMKRQIRGYFNIIAPDNMDYIFQQSSPKIKRDRQYCELFCDIAIKTSQGSATYAGPIGELCERIKNINPEEFSYKYGHKTEEEGKRNAFRLILTEKVQNRYIELISSGNLVFPYSQKEEHEIIMTEKKKQIFGLMAMIASFINKSVHQTRIISSIFYQSLIRMFEYYHKRNNQSIPKDEICEPYSVCLLVLIKFLESLGENLQKTTILVEKHKGNHEEVIEWLKNQYSKETKIKINCSSFFKLAANNYMEILQWICMNIPEIKKSMIKDLFINLQYRRQKNWKSFQVNMEQPKKMSEWEKQFKSQRPAPREVRPEKNEQKEQIKEKIAQKPKATGEEQKINTDDVYIGQQNRKTNSFLEDLFQKKQTEQVLIKERLKNTPLIEFLSSYLRVVGEDKVENIPKRIKFFNYFLEKLDKKSILKAWREAVIWTSFVSIEVPYAAAAFSEILILMEEKGMLNWKQFYIPFEQDTDERFFMDDVYQKAYHYTKSNEILNYVEAPKKCTKLIR